MTASTFCYSTAVPTGLHDASVCLVTLQAYVPAVIFRDILVPTVLLLFNSTLPWHMERCNFVNAGTETIDSTEATGHFTLQFIKGFRTYLSERRGLGRG
jgi:hypothetical protein